MANSSFKRLRLALDSKQRNIEASLQHCQKAADKQKQFSIRLNGAFRSVYLVQDAQHETFCRAHCAKYVFSLLKKYIAPLKIRSAIGAKVESTMSALDGLGSSGFWKASRENVNKTFNITRKYPENVSENWSTIKVVPTTLSDLGPSKKCKVYVFLQNGAYMLLFSLTKNGTRYESWWRVASFELIHRHAGMQNSAKKKQDETPPPAVSHLSQKRLLDFPSRFLRLAVLRQMELLTCIWYVLTLLQTTQIKDLSQWRVYLHYHTMNKKAEN